MRIKNNKNIEHEPPNIIFTASYKPAIPQSLEAERIALVHGIAVRTLGGEKMLNKGKLIATSKAG